MGPQPSWGPLGETFLSLGTIVFIIAALVEVAFLVHYVIVAPAFKSWIGWMFVIRSVSFLLSGIAIMLGRVLGPTYPLRPYVTFALYACVLASALITYGTFVYERYKRTPKRTTPNAPGSFARRAMGLLHGGRGVVQDPPRASEDPGPRLVEDRT
jgi:hypothetical protein